MSHSRRQSLSSSWIESHGSWMDTVRLGSQSPSIQISSPGPGGSNPNLIRAGVITPVKEDVDTWVKEWESVLAKDLIDSRIVTVDADATVEEACEILLKEDIPCLVVTSSPSGTAGSAPVAYSGLFDFSDVNAFLTLAATRHNFPHHQHQPNSASSEVDNTASAGGATPSIAERASEIIEAAKAGKVAVGLVSNFSQKNPFKTLSNEATVIDLLRLFSTGVHRAAIGSSGTADDHASASYEGLVSDRALLSYFSAYASRTPSFLSYLNNTLHTLHTSSSSSPILTSISLDKDSTTGSGGSPTPILLPSLYIYSDIVAAGADQPVLDAMKLMSEEGVSSVAVVEGGENGAYAGGYVPGMGTGYAGASGGGLVSAVSVTDVGKIVVPSESKQILYMPLQQFVALIKAPQGSTDGEETYPVYSLSPSSRLSYAIDKLLATNAHRLFITEDSRPPSNTASPVIKPIGLGGPLHGPGHSPGLNAGLGRGGGNRLSGIVSIVDILTVFAHIAALPAHEIDPTRQKRHRRISSNSSQSSAASSPSHSLSSSMTEQELLRSAHSVSPVLGALGLGVGGGPGVGMGSPLGRSTSKSNLASRGTNRMSGSFVLPGPIVPGHSVLGLGDVGTSLGVGGGKGASRREGGKSPAAGVDTVDKGVAGLQVGSVDGEKE